MGRVLIIGAGGVGNVVAKKCAQVKEVFTDICLASRSIGKCEKIRDEIKKNLKRTIEVAKVDKLALKISERERIPMIVTSTSIEKIKEAWNKFSGEPQRLKLPTAPLKPIHYFDDDKYPQPKIHRNIDKGMAVSVGRLREDKLFDYKFIVLSHNTIRGAAGGAILCGELMKAKGII